MDAVDVVVVGAGPAGAAAAAHLARAGRSVVLVDRATFPRDKCCGDGLTTLALRELDELGFDPGAVVDWQVVRDAVLRAPNGREVTLPLPADGGVHAAVAPRLQFDDALVDLAVKAGVARCQGDGFSGIATVEGGSAVDLTLDSGTVLRARHVVAADGMWSPVRKALGLDPVATESRGYLGEWHAFRQYAHGVTGTAAQHLHVWFEPDLLPGYAWSFPLPDGRANIGFGALRAQQRKGAELRALWTDLLERPHLRRALGDAAVLEDRVLAWPIPARVTDVTLTSGRVLLAGDAAAASDVLTGEGIGQALLMGRLAATSIVADGSAPDVAARYRREVRRHLYADHRMSAALGRVLAHRRGANGALAIVSRSGQRGRRTFARWMFEDEPRAIALTPRRWHRQMFARHGAFGG